MTYQIKSKWHWLKRLILLVVSAYVASYIKKFDLGMAIVGFVWTYAILWLMANFLIHFIDEKSKSSKRSIRRQKTTK